MALGMAATNLHPRTLAEAGSKNLAIRANLSQHHPQLQGLQAPKRKATMTGAQARTATTLVRDSIGTATWRLAYSPLLLEGGSSTAGLGVDVIIIRKLPFSASSLLA